mgnify:CR=1 FL=1
MSRPTGTTTWLDLGSTDLRAAQAFYTELFGWEFEDAGEEYGHYRMIRSNGTLVAGAMDVSGITCPDGDPLPSEWTVYLAVDDLDARVAKAQAAGAQIIVSPTVAADAGSFAIVLDLAGYPIGLWQAGDIEGYEFTAATGTPVWFEVMTHDFDAAARFYTEVLDAELVPMTEEMEDDSFRYVTNGAQDTATWGLGDATGVIPEGEGGWRIYFAVDSCDPAVERITELGGRLLDGPVDSPFGRIATVADPTGASFQICAMSEKAPEAG